MNQLSQYAKLIESLTKEQFDDVVQNFIKNYWSIETVVMVDGKGDGGIDIKVFKNKSHLKIPYQITVEQKPYNKLLKDLVKISKLIQDQGYSNEFYFFSSHTISENKLSEVTVKARSDFGITLNLIDAKFISSKILDNRFASTLAIIRKYFSSILDNKDPIFNDVEKLKYDLIIYGSEATEIKNKILDSYILLHIFNNGPQMSVSNIESFIRKDFEIGDTANPCKRELDKLVQQRKVFFAGPTNSMISLTGDERERIAALLDNLDLKEAEFISAVKSILNRIGLVDLYKEIVFQIYQVFNDLHDKDLFELSGKTNLTNESRSLKNLIQTIEKACGNGLLARKTTTELFEICEENDFIQRLTTGRLFSKLVTEPEFDTYLNISKRIAYLDSSIALHVLCALYNGKSSSRNLFYKTAVDLILYTQESEGKIQLKIANHYLDEIVYHIKDAIRILEYYKYEFFLQLGKSSNVFLAFYEDLYSHDELPQGVNTFRDFLIDFGFIGENGNPERASNFINESLLVHFRRANIEVVQLYEYSTKSKITYQDIKKMIEVELTNRGNSRHNEVIKRDTLMCCFLFDRLKHGDVDPIFITWDNIFYDIRKVYHNDHPNAPFWHLFRPTKFLDHMSLLNLTINGNCITNDILSIIETEFSLAQKVVTLKDVFSKILDLKSENGWKLAQAIAKLQSDEIYKLKEKAGESEFSENTSVEFLIAKLYEYYKTKKGKYGIEDLKECTYSDKNLSLLVTYLNKELSSYRKSGKWGKDVFNNLDYIIGLHKENKLPE